MKTKLPEITQQCILHVDGTPDDGYVLRILQAYRENCNCKWSDTTDGGKVENPLLKIMNEHQDQRAKLLDEAIACLTNWYDNVRNSTKTKKPKKGSTWEDWYGDVV